MKTITFKGTAKSAYGYALTDLKVKEGSPALPKAGLPYGGTYQAFENFDELVKANEQLTNDEQVKARNNQLKAKHKAAAAKLAFEAAGIIEPTMANDVQLQLKAVYDGIMAGGKKTAEEARALAASVVGEEWADDNDE